MMRAAPPQAPLAEQAVIGAILLDPKAIERVAPVLAASDFYSPQRRHVFEAVLELHQNNRIVDEVTLKEHLRLKGALDDRLEARLAEDAAAVPSAASVLDYAQDVQTAARRREAIQTLRGVEESLVSGNAHVLVEELESLTRQVQGVFNRSSSNEPNGLVFRTVESLSKVETEEVRWLCKGLIASGYLTLITAKPKGGKSTWMFALLAALERGTSLHGLETSSASAVYVSEESAATIEQKARRFGVKTARFLSRRDAYPRRPFREIVRAAVDEALRTVAGLVVIDTLAMWAGLRDEAEKDAGAMQAAADVLLEATARGIAVVVLHHTRKAAGDVIDSARGSNALAAAADIVVHIGPVKGERRQRLLSVVGRDEECSGDLGVRLLDDGSGFERVGSEAQASETSLCRRILEVLPEQPDEGKTTEEVVNAVRKAKKPVVDLLRQLVKKGEVIRSGRGVRSDPARFSRPTSEYCSEPRSPMGRTETDSSRATNGNLVETGQIASTHSVSVLPIGNPDPRTETAPWLLHPSPLPDLGHPAEVAGLWDDLWNWCQERAAVLEHESGLPREEAERRAWEEVSA